MEPTCPAELEGERDPKLRHTRRALMNVDGPSSVTAAQRELELRALSDDELVSETLPLTKHFGCNLVAGAVATTLLAVLGFGATIGSGVFVLGASLAAVALRWHSATPRMCRARAAQREFGRRFGAAPLAQLLPEARAQLAGDAELEALGLFRAVSLPHGGLRSIRVELRARPTIAVSTSPFLGDLQRGDLNLLAVSRRELPLKAAQAERMRGLLRELRPELLTVPANFVTDGFPCEAVVLQRGAAELHARANLAGLPQALHAHPTVRLLELFLDFDVDTEPRL